ncbi:MAG: VCBS repeat-containing protein [Saprospiraceae bacterium]|nr:VCBS repeat-containing protein [Saprospiraceae bacterium]
MKRLQFLILAFIVFSVGSSFSDNKLVAQTTFSKWTTGPVVNTPSDSRSINLVDMDGDGLDEIFISNGPSSGAKDFLYFNKGDFNFEEDTLKFQSLGQSSVGASIGDISNSGMRSIFVATWYNQFNGFYMAEFPDFWKGQNAPVRTYSETVALSDINNDGFLDLYVSNSGNGPADNKNQVYLNDGSGKLNLLQQHPLTVDADHSRGVSFIDYDNDGDSDLFICNENNTRNTLFKNNGDGTYSKVSAAGDLFAKTGSTMSASWGDINNDGYLDLLTTNAGFFTAQDNLIYLNKGDGTFENPSSVVESDLSCSYSSAFADYDNDGDLDLVITNGYCNGSLRNFLYLNDGEGIFSRDTSSIADLSTPCSFGVAWSDLDNNGFQDLVIATCKNTSASALPNNLIYRNEGNENNWLKLNLKGVQSNADGIGVRIVASAQINGELVNQTRIISSQTGYAGQNSLTVHFGMADTEIVDNLTIYWPSGVVQELSNAELNKTLEIYEPGSSSIAIQNDLFSFTVSPNPASEKIFIHAEFKQSPDTLHIELSDLAGKSRLKRTFEKVSTEFKLTIDAHELSLAGGTYILSLSIPGQQIVKQIVVMK